MYTYVGTSYIPIDVPHIPSLPSWLQYMILPILPSSKELNRDNYNGADFMFFTPITLLLNAY